MTLLAYIALSPFMRYEHAALSHGMSRKTFWQCAVTYREIVKEWPWKERR